MKVRCHQTGDEATVHFIPYAASKNFKNLNGVCVCLMCGCGYYVYLCIIMYCTASVTEVWLNMFITSLCSCCYYDDR